MWMNFTTLSCWMVFWNSVPVKIRGHQTRARGTVLTAKGHRLSECTGKRRKSAAMRKSAPNGVAQEGKQVQRNAANARERARMRVLSKAFSRLKTTLPWVPPDTKLSKLDTLRLASSYIAHLRQILANDKYENGYIHPVNLVRDFKHFWKRKYIRVSKKRLRSVKYVQCNMLSLL